ncbi:MAG: FKBP-type peptidyl-prolyl cis-trans isomerase SlpA [Candidatus Azotimanducaceae bacterium]|jgi:FKBP-type peptidyl-prolyl cis-trans isomerase SlpA
MSENIPSGVPIGPGTKVSLTFSLCLVTGEVVDTTGNKPAVFVVGDGKLLPGFERAMFGLTAGNSKSLFIPAEAAFGIPQEDNRQRIKRSQFQSNMELAEGLMMSFADAQNAELPGLITAVSDDYVDVDFNHPLAGKDLNFDVAIVSVEQVSNEILRVNH